MHRIRFTFASAARRHDYRGPAFFRPVLFAAAALLIGFLPRYAAAQSPPPGKLGLPFGFQGARYDDETGLYYFRNRYYDPRTGRFLQRDPRHDPANMGNPYIFVGNSPVSRRDPMGLQQSGSVQTPCPPTPATATPLSEPEQGTGAQPNGIPIPERPPGAGLTDFHGNYGGRNSSTGSGWNTQGERVDWTQGPTSSSRVLPWSNWFPRALIVWTPLPTPEPPPVYHGPDPRLSPDELEQIEDMKTTMQEVQGLMDAETKLRDQYFALQKLRETLPPESRQMLDSSLRSLESRLSELDPYFEPPVD